MTNQKVLEVTLEIATQEMIRQIKLEIKMDNLLKKKYPKMNPIRRGMFRTLYLANPSLGKKHLSQ